MTDYAYAARLISHFEGFIAVARWDVNAYRLGFGSDTEGPEQRHVTKGMTTTRARALQNLEKRIPKFEAEIIRQIGAAAWSRLPTHVQGPLLSVAYNYGDLPDGVAHAVRSGNVNGIASAIKAHENDNHGVNKNRRIAEAAIIASNRNVA